MNSDSFISVVAPLTAAPGQLPGFLATLSGILAANYTNYEIILVDHSVASENATVLRSALKEIECLRVIRLSRPFPFDVAVTAGLESSIGDYVVIMDPSSDPPACIPEMVRLAAEGIGLVVGVAQAFRNKGLTRSVLAKVFHWYVRRFLGTDLIPQSTNFRVLSRQAVNAVTGIKGRYRQLRFLTSTIGYGKYAFPYEPVGPPPRVSFWSQVSEGADMLIANSTHPLRAVSLLGLLASAANLLYLGYVVVIYLIKRDVAPGWTTLSLQTGGMFFLLFLLLATLSEYVGRILAETRSQPLYNVLDELNSSVLLKDADARRNVVEESR
jgi:polyisoprenyl-phosphate glycosyltransferase